MGTRQVGNKQEAKTKPSIQCEVSENGFVTADKCFELGLNPADNRMYCLGNKCCSPSRLCLSCVTYNEVDKTSFVVVPEIGFCVFHDKHGYLARKDGDNEAIENMHQQTKSARARVALKNNGKEKPELADWDFESIEGNEDHSDDEFDLDIESKDKPDKTHSDNSKKSALTALSEGLSNENLSEALCGKEILEIPLDRIIPDDEQPRDKVRPENVVTLSESIAVVGQTTPGVVVRVVGSTRYDFKLKVGEHRWRALKLLGKPTFRAYELNTKDKDIQYLFACVENLASVEYSEVEKAKMLQTTKERMGWSVEKVANAFAMDPMSAHGLLNILKIDVKCHKYIGLHLPKGERITLSVVKVLSKFPEADHLRHVKHVVDKKMTSATANTYLETEAKTAGIEFPKRRLTRHSNQRNFTNYLSRIFKKLNEYNGKDMKDVFKGRHTQGRREVCSDIDSIVHMLEKIKKDIL